MPSCNFFVTLNSQLSTRFSAAITGSNLEAIDPWIEVAPAALVEVARFLRDEPDMQFALLNCITGVDYIEPARFEVIYHLSSLTHKCRIVLKVVLPRWKDDVPGQLPEVPSVSSVWTTAVWHEREVFDLSGVRFTGHPDLRRILCPEDWVGHPLRKDYQVPDEYHGIKVRCDR